MSSPRAQDIAGLRIIGGKFRGRKLAYDGDPATRPMKDRVREAMFNLIGPAVKDSWVLDLFAGTGAIGLEALSRGAAAALFLERRFPTADVIRGNVATLQVADACEIVSANTLVWIRLPATLADLASPARQGRPWIVFCSPPYQLYLDQPTDMLNLLTTLADIAPPGSTLVVECDARFDVATLPRATDWLVRTYPPAVLGLWRKP